MGGGGVKNCLKFRDVIYGRPLNCGHIKQLSQYYNTTTIKAVTNNVYDKDMNTKIILKILFLCN